VFSLYTNDLPSVVKFLRVESYVDDAKVYLSCSLENINSCLAKVSEDLRLITSWCCTNKLLINPDKTKLVLFGTKQLLSKVPDFRVPFLGQQLISVCSVKDLGVIAALQLAKRASEAPWVRKIGNSSSRENLVMTSAYERANVRPSIRTDSRGGGGASRDILHGHPYGKIRNAVFPWRFFV